MANVKKGQKLVCVPCGREVVVSSSGVSRTTLWCCNRPMKSGLKKKSAKKIKAKAKKRVARKKK